MINLHACSFLKHLPPPGRSSPGMWLDAGGAPIVPVVVQRSTPARGACAVAHVPFKASSDAKEMAALLTSKVMEFSKLTLEHTVLKKIPPENFTMSRLSSTIRGRTRLSENFYTHDTSN